GDHFQQSGELPLQTLRRFCKDYLQGIVTGIHILPFFPYTSDDGFSVKDYLRVNPELGDWNDIEEIASDFRLMVDAVINHCSSQHIWFQKFLTGEHPYINYFICVPSQTDLSSVVRPRTSPLLTPFETTHGIKYLWTTFSADQIDLNFKSQELLLEILQILFEYVKHGAQVIRLDAIAYLWKEIGAPCIHLPQTHWIIQLFRAVLNVIAPYVYLITETNVPHTENLSYFGDGYNEAQMVYNFALPPLVLHAIQRGDASYLTRWASHLSLPSSQVTFFNFLASHDGIGINPVADILPEVEINFLIETTQQLGGYISYKNNANGLQVPYELNINYLDALGDPLLKVSLDTQMRRFMVAQAIMLAFQGVPGIYVHSLLGSRGWADGVKMTGQKRAVNRQKFSDTTIRQELSTTHSLRNLIFSEYSQLLKARASSAAFHPQGTQKILDLSGQLFAFERISPQSKQRVLCLHNVSNQELIIQIPKEYRSAQWKDLLHPKRPVFSNLSSLQLSPYQVFWLEMSDGK
ncbi:MAG: sugar phosphorylase, partial [Anaerolineales bacterium]